MLRRTRLAGLSGVLITALVLLTAGSSTQPVDAAGGHGAQGARASFHDAMRQLWESHIVWTRQYIVSAATGPADLADIGPTTARLLANQGDIGDALKPYYGEAAGDRVSALLRAHILTAAELIAAARSGDGVAAEAASRAWYRNADEIAVALHRLNPDQWPLAALEMHMKDHLDLTLAEAVARLEGRYADDIAAYDAIHAQILGMADMLSDGIIAQFPSRFAR